MHHGTMELIKAPVLQTFSTELFLQKLCYGWEKYADVKEPSFRQFVDCLVQKPTEKLWESHTHPLTSLCGVCRMDYNIVCKLFLPQSFYVNKARIKWFTFETIEMCQGGVFIKMTLPAWSRISLNESAYYFDHLIQHAVSVMINAGIYLHLDIVPSRVG